MLLNSMIVRVDNWRSKKEETVQKGQGCDTEALAKTRWCTYLVART